jgi:hypothetical protein
MKLAVLGRVGLATLSLVVLTATMAPAASGREPKVPLVSPGSASSPVRAHPAIPDDACYDQRINDNGNAVVSQNFEKENNAYDSRGADDFTLDTACTVTEVQVDGQYQGAGPPRSMHVTFYQDNQGTPGAVVSGQKRLSYTDETGSGSFDITLKRPVTLDPGHYWVSVKANMSFTTHGEWFWNTNNEVNGVPAQWRNALDGFGTGCTTYTAITACVPDEGADFSFALIQ